MTNIYNFFKFIESKEPEYKTPLKTKLMLVPNEITKEDLHVKGDFFLKDDDDNDRYKDITSLPDGMTVDGHFWGEDYLTSLPDNLTVGKNLYIPYNKDISSLPKDLKVEGNFIIYNTPLAKKYTEEEIRKMAPGVKGKIYFNKDDYYKDGWGVKI
jgi:hypothetical protein